MSQPPSPANVDLRIDRLEGVVCGGTAVLVAAVLVLGLLLPYLTLSDGGKVETVDIVSMGFLAMGSAAHDAVSVLFGVAFLGLSVVVIGAVLVLVGIGRRRGSARVASWARVLRTLLIVGTVGAWLVVALGAGRDPNAAFAVHEGIFWLTAGTAGFTCLVSSQTFRQLWVRG